MTLKDRIKESQKELKLISTNPKEIIVKAKFGPSKPTKIPLKINEELAFFIGAIIEDGHLKKDKHQITLEGTNIKLLNFLQKICKELFEREFNINSVKKREGKKQSDNLVMDSKAIYNLLNNVYEIPIGKKSHIVKIPKEIFNSTKSIKSAFLIGIMMTDGGKRRRNVGLSTASKKLWEDLIKLFKKIEIKMLIDKWIYKKYDKEYYGITFKPIELKKIMRMCRSGQTGQILLEKFIII